MSGAIKPPWEQAFGQLTRTIEAAPRPRFNPHPSGILQAGSATQAVNAFLEARPGRFFTAGQLIAATDRSDKSIDWALLMLRSLDRIEWRSDESRNPRHRRYRFKPEVVAKGGQP